MPHPDPQNSLVELATLRPAWVVEVTAPPSGAGAEGDPDLVRQALAGDPRAFESLVLRYERQIYVHLLKMTGRPEDAEDLAQETFLRALRGLATYRPSQPFRPWLYRIATNTAISALRRRGPAMLSLDGCGEDEHPMEIADARAESPVEILGREEMLAQLEEALASLPAEGAALVNLRYREGMSFEEIGKVLGRKPGAVAVMMHRIRKRLRELIF